MPQLPGSSHIFERFESNESTVLEKWHRTIRFHRCNQKLAYYFIDHAYFIHDFMHEGKKCLD